MRKQLSANFFKKVYEVVKLIPPGKVTTYGAIANYLGTTRSARMVGWALNQAKCQEDVPAHRVVNKQGLLTGKQHFISEKSMEKLLAEEGIQVKNNQVQNFTMVFWSPNELEVS